MAKSKPFSGEPGGFGLRRAGSVVGCSIVAVLSAIGLWLQAYSETLPINLNWGIIPPRSLDMTLGMSRKL